MKRLMFVFLVLSSLSVQAASVYVTPSPVTVGLGASFSVDIRGDFTDVNIQGGSLNVSYNKNILTATSSIVDSIWTFGVQNGDYTTTPGVISDIVFGSFSKAPGDYLIATLQFDVEDVVGSSSIGLAVDGFNFVDKLTGEFTPLFEDGTVNAIPIPAAVWLFGSAILGLGAAGRRKKA